MRRCSRPLVPCTCPAAKARTGQLPCSAHYTRTVCGPKQAVAPAPTLQRDCDGLHPNAPATRGLPGGRDNPSHPPGTSTKGVIGSVTECDRTALAASACSRRSGASSVGNDDLRKPLTMIVLPRLRRSADHRQHYRVRAGGAPMADGHLTSRLGYPIAVRIENAQGSVARVRALLRCRCRVGAARRRGCCRCCWSCPTRRDGRSRRRTTGRCSRRSRSRFPSRGSWRCPR
jgi:hypothetical protein